MFFLVVLFQYLDDVISEGGEVLYKMGQLLYAVVLILLLIPSRFSEECPDVFKVNSVCAPGWNGQEVCWFTFVCLFSLGCVICDLIQCFQATEDGQESTGGSDDAGKTGQTTTYIGRSFSVVTGRVGRLYYE